MTYKETLERTHPEALSAVHPGGCKGCPGDYFDGAPTMLDEACVGTSCTECWNRSVPGTKKKVVYIAGPITGVNRYWEPFEKAEDAILAEGWIPLSPARHPQGMTNEAYVRINMAMIDSSDAVLLLPGSDKSLGACLEIGYCEYIGKPFEASIKELRKVLI